MGFTDLAADAKRAPGLKRGEWFGVQTITAAADELRQSRMAAARTERLGRIGSWAFDLRTDELSWSDGTYEIFAIQRPRTPTLAQFVACFEQAHRLRLRAAFDDAVGSGRPFDIALHCITAAGAEKWLRLAGLIESDENGGRQLVGTVRDITEERFAEERLVHLAEHDPLTGLCNRRVLVDALQRAISHACPTHGLTLILVDVDHFKDINDLHGHVVGDALLVEIARRLSASASPRDLVARLGGDEFALMCAGADKPAMLLSRTLSFFNSELDLRSGPLRASVSLGAAICVDPDATPDQVLRNADAALYEAKGSGRSKGFVFRRSMGVALEKQRILLDEVGRALRANEFDVFYQPMVDLRTLAIRGVEALVRWRHASRGILGPDTFKAALDDPVLSRRIGTFVLEKSLSQMRQWIDTGIPIPCVNINVSQAQLQCADELFRQITRLLERGRLKGSNVKLEILESAFLGYRPETIIKLIARLRRRGVVMALDDFGTGHASLTHLKKFDIGRIKIDRSFITDVQSNPSNRAITRAIIDLGANLGLRVVAEGIEELPQLAMLIEADCDCGQGFLFSRPIPADEMAGFIRSWAQHGPALFRAAGRTVLEPARVYIRDHDQT